MHAGIIKKLGANIWQAISLCLTLSVAPHIYMYLYHKSQGQPKSLGVAWCLIIPATKVCETLDSVQDPKPTPAWIKLEVIYIRAGWGLGMRLVSHINCYAIIASRSLHRLAAYLTCITTLGKQQSNIIPEFYHTGLLCLTITYTIFFYCTVITLGLL